MTSTPQFINEPAGRIPVAATSDLVVVGGGPAGIAAALAGARNRLSVTLLERYPYLGGLASGGMVLVLDDMCNGQEIAVRGLCADLIARLERLGLAVTPPEADRRFEYRYRAARAVMDNLAQNREAPPDNTRDNTPGDDETVVSTRLWDRRNYERLED